MTGPIVDASGRTDPDDDSAGYERVAREFIARREHAPIGASVATS